MDDNAPGGPTRADQSYLAPCTWIRPSNLIRAALMGGGGKNFDKSRYLS